LLAVLAAGRGQYYTGRYTLAGGELRRESEFAVQNAEELRSACAGPGETSKRSGGGRALLITGEVLAADLASEGPRSNNPPADGVDVATRGRVLSPAAGLRRPGFLAELGQWSLESRGTRSEESAALLQPIYLRRSPGLGDDVVAPAATLKV
jgi:hypothetical protein